MKLETKRLTLRPLQKNDWKDLVEGVSEYDVAKMTENIPHPYNKKDAVSFIDRAIEGWNNDTQKTFAIELKKEHKVIGLMGLVNLNKFKGTATSGSWINKKYWKKGYITEAKIAINDFAFNKLKLRRLNSTVFVDNKASNATQRKMGYVFEGMQRKAAKSKTTGKIHDLNIYGLLKDDWVKVRKKIIADLKRKN